MSEPSIETLTQRLIAFRDARDWKQFHSLKDLIISLNLEAAELLELTQWQSETAFEEAIKDETTREKLEQEVADVFLYLLLVCERAGIDLLAAADRKIDINARKYPPDKARGRATKYTDF